MEQLGLKTPRSFTATETKTQGVPKTASKLSRKRGGSAIERWINRFMFTSLAKPLSSGYLPSMANSFATPSKSVQKRGSVVSRRATKGASSKVTFSGVTVIAPKPASADVKRNVAMSSEALERAKKRLMRPGVRLYARKDVPLYSADPDRPGVFIRELNGKTECGVLENGTFKVTG
ncbi:hypothetical protein [Brevundimonas sp.]|uniref:hypothetical protein n=1 Tax=Brevundimonas sp. TaxID=1871086 RepID=UPI0028A19BCC|nr:hypothetical protein [Brevundimonas sp.]